MAYEIFDGRSYSSSPTHGRREPLLNQPMERDEFGRALLSFDEDLYDGRPRPGAEHAYLRDENGAWVRRLAPEAMKNYFVSQRPEYIQPAPPPAENIAWSGQGQIDRDEAGRPLLFFDDDLFDGRPRPGAEALYKWNQDGHWQKTVPSQDLGPEWARMPSPAGNAPSVFKTLEDSQLEPLDGLMRLLRQESAPSAEEGAKQTVPVRQLARKPAEQQTTEPVAEEDPNQRHLYEDYTEKEYEWDTKNYIPKERPYKPTHEDIRLDPRRVIMRHAPESIPPQMNIRENAKEALEVRRLPLSLRIYWYFHKVKNYGPWDYKRTVTEEEKRELQARYKEKRPFEQFGNYNAGFFGALAGIPPELLRRGAGGYQIWTDIKRYLEHLFDQENTHKVTIIKKGSSSPIGIFPYGDDPKDQYQIQRGIDDAHRYLQLLESNKLIHE